MLSLFLEELGIYTKRIPGELEKLNDELFFKWKLLKMLLVRDVLGYMMPFVVNAGRCSFYELVDNAFSGFFNGTLQDDAGMEGTLRHKIRAFIIMRSKTPSLCSNKCCFSFIPTIITFDKVLLFVIENECNEPFKAKNYCTDKKIFDEWYEKRVFGNHTITFS